MDALLKCAACGAEVTFDSDSLNAEAVCPGCEVHLRRRAGDEHMAIPVGMTLPEKFRPLDLKLLAKQSDVLVERYRKEPPAPAPALSGSAVDATLAKALESLAHTISHLDERLARQERRTGEGHPGENELGYREEYQFGHGGQGAPGESREQINGQGGHGQEEVVHLDPGMQPVRALPLRSPVLVRREAAQEAHRFRRERQQFWDDRGREQAKVGFFRRLMEEAPKTTVTVTLLLCVALTAGVIVFMDPGYGGSGQKVTVLQPTQVTSLGKLWVDDPEAAHAELVAKAFLNATSAQAARSLVFESESLGESFDRLYQPISSPDNYELELKSRVRAPDGQGSIFVYRVTTSDQLTRMMVVVPEGKMPKVYWQFFAEVGDMSWDEFMEKRPGEATRMLVWVEPGREYFSPYSEDRWTSYLLHDYEDRYTLRAFVERSTGPDWRLSNALENEPRKFGRRIAVMAQVDVAFMSEMQGADEETLYVVEIKGVEATDWLPARFRPREGPTIEASEVEAVPEAGK